MMLGRWPLIGENALLSNQMQHPTSTGAIEIHLRNFIDERLTQAPSTFLGLFRRNACRLLFLQSLKKTGEENKPAKNSLYANIHFIRRVVQRDETLLRHRIIHCEIKLSNQSSLIGSTARRRDRGKRRRREREGKGREEGGLEDKAVGAKDRDLSV